MRKMKNKMVKDTDFHIGVDLSSQPDKSVEVIGVIVQEEGKAKVRILSKEEFGYYPDEREK